MRKTIVFMLVAFAANALNAQTENTQGQVIYEVVRKIEIKINGMDAAQLNLPKESRKQKELLFNSDASFFHGVKKNQDDAVTQESSGGGMVSMQMYESEEVVFFDIKSKIKLEQRDFLTRKFLVETKTDTIQWKLTGNQKEVNGYSCMEAELVGSKRKTIAWFTPMIPVSTGPDGYVGLPGLILAIDIEDGKTTYTAQTINLKDIDASLLVKPKEGKKVTSKEFKKIMDEKIKEMGGTPGGGHSETQTVIIRM